MGLEKKLGEISEDNEKKSADLTELSAQCQRGKEQLEQKEQAMSNLQDKLAYLENEKTELQKTNGEFQETVEEITSKMNKLDQDKKDAEENFKISLAHHENAIKALEEEKISSLGKITMLQGNVEGFKVDLDKKDQDLVKDKAHIDDLKKE